MTSEESRRDEAGRWLAQARKDLNAARLLASEEPSRSVFHSQLRPRRPQRHFSHFTMPPFRKTHDLNELGHQCADLNPSLTPVFREASDLTDYAVVFRYLDAPREPDADEAIAAIATATCVLEAVRLLLAPPL